MVDARNAILAADQMRFGGANQTELWAAFARRGLGALRVLRTTRSGRVRGVESDTNPLPDFEAPGQTQRDGDVRGDRAGAGSRRSTRGSTSATTRRASRRSPTPTRRRTPRRRPSANNLDETAVFAPGTYEFIATAPGYGAVRFRGRSGPATTRRSRSTWRPTARRKTQGATATRRRRAGDVAGPTEVQPAPQVRKNLIDDTEATDWQAAATQGADGA